MASIITNHYWHSLHCLYERECTLSWSSRLFYVTDSWVI